MKKLVVLTMVASVTSLFASWSTVVGTFKKEVPTTAYTIDTSGINPRVYEFDTQGEPRAHCIVIFRDNSKTAPAMQCFRIGHRR